MIKKYMKKSFLFGLGVALGLLLPAMALADVSITFDQGTAVVTAGSSLKLSGTLTNNGSQSVYFNSNSASVQSIGLLGQITGGYVPGITTDPITNSLFPPTLGPGQVYQGSLLQLDFASTTQTSSYWGLYNLSWSPVANSVATSGSASQLFNFTVIAPTVSAPANTNTNTNTSTSSSSSLLQMPNGTNSTTGVTATTTGGLQMPAGLQYGDSGTANTYVDQNGILSVNPYSNGPRLIKLDGDQTVYWVSPNNLKIALLSYKVFLSYGLKASDVQTVGKAEFDYYPSAKYIWLNGGGAIYQISNGIKQQITSDVWNSTGLDATAVISVNKQDFDSYQTGNKITYVLSLQ